MQDQQSRLSLILFTIEKNFLTDCQIDYTQQNKINILQLYQTVYQIPDQSDRQKRYFQLKKLINNKTQLQILKWFQTNRSHKYSIDILPGAKISLNQKKIKLCHNPDYLHPSRFVSYGYQIAVKYEASVQSIKIGKSFFEIKRHNKVNKNYLFRQIKGRDELPTPWLVERTKDHRYIWRGDVPIDRHDVQNLLKFILAKRSQKDQCPSILINAGSHGGRLGQNAHDVGSFEYTDMKIYEETLDTICQLLQQCKQILKLNFQNLQEKAYVRQLSSVDPCIYPVTADHIIDVQCFGAFSKIPVQVLYPKGSQIIDQDLKFRFQETIKPRLPIKNLEDNIPETVKQLINNSQIIKTKIHAEILLNYLSRFQLKMKGFFQFIPRIKVVESIQLIFRASEHDFSIEKYFQRCGLMEETVIVCLTQKDKIIGAYSPFYHKFKKGFWSWLQSYGEWVSDDKKRSFIFSLTTNDIFFIRDTTKAIFRYKDNDRIVFGLDEFAICNKSNQVEDCWMNVNFAYFNKKYLQSNSIKYNTEECLKLNGNQTPSFMTKQWEVWKLTFTK